MERTPTTWCPGCGIGIVVQSIIRAIDDQGLYPNLVAMVGGVGCAAHVTSYLKFDAFHGLHGRVPTQATGIKLAKPELTVLCLLGDGDGLAIGGNQFYPLCEQLIVPRVPMASRLNGQSGPRTRGRRDRQGPGAQVQGSRETNRLLDQHSLALVSLSSSAEPNDHRTEGQSAAQVGCTVAPRARPWYAARCYQKEYQCRFARPR